MLKSDVLHRTFTKSEILDADEIFWPSSVSVLTLKIDDFVHEFPWFDSPSGDNEESVLLKGIEEKYAEQLATCKIAALNNMTPLHDETYCYSKENKQWYLIAEGRGYA